MTSPLTIDEARAVLWPFATPRRPIGDLLDAGRIGEPDLQRAARVAYSRRVKSACSVLLSIRRQPATPITVKPIARVAYPTTCPICAEAVRPDHRVDSIRHGAGWRCETHGLAHCLQLRYLAALKAVYAPEAWIIPPCGDYPGVRRRDLARGPIGYLSQANQ